MQEERLHQTDRIVDARGPRGRRCGMRRGGRRRIVAGDHGRRERSRIFHRIQESRHQRIQSEDSQEITIAKCLSSKGAVLYGASWCSYTQQQKTSFKDGFQYLSYVECTEQAAVCEQNGISGYPTWIIGGSRILGYRLQQNRGHRRLHVVGGGGVMKRIASALFLALAASGCSAYRGFSRSNPEGMTCLTKCENARCVQAPVRLGRRLFG